MTIEARRAESASLTISIETIIYLIIGLAAMGLRSAALGATPLDEFEAQQAMMAWRSIGNIPISPVLMGAISMSVSLIGASEAAVRLMPMLSGMALVFMPLAFRRTMGRLPTLLTSALLAISPVAVASSRRVDGTVMAALCFVGMLACLARPRPQRTLSALLAGISLGLSLACDYSTPLALLTMGLGLGFALVTDDQNRTFRQAWIAWRADFRPVQLMLGIVGATMVGGTLFFFYPSGLSAIANHLEHFVTGILHREAGMPPLSAILGLYEPLIVGFGLIGAWLTVQSDDPWKRFVSAWGVATALVMLVYPGTRPPHALWAVLPLTVLAGLTIQTLLTDAHDKLPNDRWGMGITILLICLMALANLTRYLQNPHLFDFQELGLSFTVPAELALSILFFLLVWVVWLIFASQLGAHHAWAGMGIGMMVFLTFVTVSHAASLALDRPTDPHELWNVLPAQREIMLMVETAEEVSRMVTSTSHEIDMVVEGAPNGMIGWALRDFENVTFVDAVSPDMTASVVITPADTRSPTLGSDYVGQDFTVARAWEPSWANADQFLLWLFYRVGEIPSQEYRFILWVQEDIYRLLPNELQYIDLESES